MFKRERGGGTLKYLTEEDYQIWLNAFLTMFREHCYSRYGLNSKEVITSFCHADIETIRKTECCSTHTSIVVLCVKNDLARIQMLVKHYRNIGIRKFAILDNGSTDGTFEWLVLQNDIDLYKTSDKYSSSAKEGWVNRIVSQYGFNRWYILTDSDELIKYIGIEKYDIERVIKFAEENGYVRLQALTVDMYSENSVFSHQEENKIEDEYCWMDTDSYFDSPKQVGNYTLRWLTGGPRYRVMGVSTSLIKFPLIYFTPGTLSANAHFVYPYKLLVNAPCVLAILHYKFLDNDKKKYEERAKRGSGFAFGGEYYKKYLESIKTNSTFMYENSIRFDSSDSLESLPYIEKMRLNC